VAFLTGAAILVASAIIMSFLLRGGFILADHDAVVAA